MPKPYCFHEIGQSKSQWAIEPREFRRMIDAAIITTPGMLELHFDDARLGVWKYARPYLEPFIKRKAVRAIIFPVTDWLDGKNIPQHEKYSEFMDWEQLDDCLLSGFELGSHGVSHKSLISGTTSGVLKELLCSKKLIEQELGVIVDKFSYPYGHYNLEIMKQVREHYSYAYCLNEIILAPGFSCWEIPRQLVVQMHEAKQP